MVKICRECKKQRPLSAFYKNNINKDGLTHFCETCKRRYTQQYRENNPDKVRAAVRRWTAANAQRKAQTSKQYRLKNSEKIKAYMAEWRRKNLAHKNALGAQYRAAKLQRTPKWLTKEHKNQIKQIYALAKELRWLAEDILVVDHVVPLQGKIVSGLHVPWNLQVISNAENSAKRHRF